MSSNQDFVLRTGGPAYSTPTNLTRHTPITMARNPVDLVITECIAVTSALRKHPRWAHSSVSAILSGGPSKPPPLDLASRRSTPVAAEEDGAGWRWGSRSKKGKSLQDDPLISAFTRLRSELRGCKGTCPRLVHVGYVDKVVY
jgi:brefeldin A-resistance guanine nucleotide exchange factor 1